MTRKIITLGKVCLCFVGATFFLLFLYSITNSRRETELLQAASDRLETMRILQGNSDMMLMLHASREELARNSTTLTILVQENYRDIETSRQLRFYRQIRAAIFFGLAVLASGSFLIFRNYSRAYLKN